MKKSIFSLIILFIIHSTFTIENCVSQWIYQALPAYYEVKDVKFFDANTGIITINLPARGMLRTTNGGNNWIIMDTNILIFDIQKIDSTTMYAVGRNRNAIDRIQRTTNKGLTWDSTNFPLAYGFNSLSFINKDTGWVSGFNGNNYVIWKTTNGGITLQIQASNIGNGRIFFLKQKVNGEYYGWQNNDLQLWRTTNSGNSWQQVFNPSNMQLTQIAFINENTGWQASGGDRMYKTTNGGSNWVNQPLVPGIANIWRSITRFVIINNNADTIYGVNGAKLLNGGGLQGLIWKTTNSGLNWGFQEIDTSFHIGYCSALDFVNSKTGWAYQGNGVNTTNGGGVIIYPTYILNGSEKIVGYLLTQNYPNPFNPVTTIEFNLPKVSYVNLSIYDITGKSVINVLNGFLLSGGTHRYRIEEFGKLNLSSGTYFYRLEARDISGAVVFNKTKRMIYMK